MHRVVSDKYEQNIVTSFALSVFYFTVVAKIFKCIV